MGSCEYKGESTLTEIARDHSSSMNMDASQDQSPLESTMISRDQQLVHNSSGSTGSDSSDRLYTDVAKSHRGIVGGFSPQKWGQNGRGRRYSPRYHSSPAPVWHQRGNNTSRGRSRGRQQFNRRGSPSLRFSGGEKMSSDERDFLYGASSSSCSTIPRSPDKDGYITPRKTSKLPTSDLQNSSTSSNKNSVQNYSITSQFTDHQKKGLVELGLMPNSDFVKNIVASSSKPTVNALNYLCESLLLLNMCQM